MIESLSSTSTTPIFYYQSPHTVMAVATSRNSLLEWWRVNKNSPPFNRFVADRVDRPEACILRIGLGYQNEGETVSRLFWKSHTPCVDLPVQNESFIEAILKNPHRIYRIENHSYRILRLISSSGCYGDVFLAHNLETQSEVAIKVLRNSYDSEQAVLKKISMVGGHPNIVTYIGTGLVLGRTGIVMEYIRGQTLGGYLQRHSMSHDLQMQYQSAMKFLCEHNIQTERENDSENILITIIDQTPTLKLIDFGTLARR